MAHIGDGSFDAPFLGSPVGVAGAWRKVIMGGQLQQARMKVNSLAPTFQHDAFGVVVQDGAWTTDVFEGVDVSAQEVFHLLVKTKLQKQRPRIGGGEHKAGQDALGTAHPDFTEVRPVGLTRLPREGPQTQRRPPEGWGAAWPPRAATARPSPCSPGRAASRTDA